MMEVGGSSVPTFTVKTIFISPDDSDAGFLETTDPARALDALRRPWSLLEESAHEEFMEAAREDSGEEDPGSDYFWERTEIKCSEEPGHTIRFYARDDYYINPSDRDLLRSWGLNIPHDCGRIQD
jgi:hypothetical protein